MNIKSIEIELIILLEYYHCKEMNISVNHVKDDIHAICNLHPNLIFMDQTSLLVNGVRILGCSLWSRVPEHAHVIAESSLNDYNLIMVVDPNSPGKLMPLTAEISTQWFEDDLKWIKSEIEESVKRGEKSTVVLSHHTPSFFMTSALMYTTHPTKSYTNIEDGPPRRWSNCCFSTDLEELFEGHYNIKVWSYGHTHYNNDQVIKGTRLISNQRGYLGRTEKDYSSRCVFYVDA